MDGVELIIQVLIAGDLALKRSNIDFFNKADLNALLGEALAYIALLKGMD